LSDEAKVAYLKERINQAKNMERINWIILFFGIGSTYFGWDSSNIGLMIVGVILFVFGFIAGLYYTSQKNKFMEQLRDIGFKNA